MSGRVVPARPDFGLPGLNTVMSSADKNAGQFALAETIKNQISMFEDRLINISVNHVVNEDDPASLYFRINANLKDNSDEVNFETVVRNGSIIKVFL